MIDMKKVRCIVQRIGPFLFHRFDDVGNVAFQHGAESTEHVAVIPLYLVFIITIHHRIQDAGSFGQLVAADAVFIQKPV